MVDVEKWERFIATDGGDAAQVKRSLRSFAAEVLRECAGDLWRNGAEPIRSVKTKRAQDRRYALGKIRKLASAYEKGKP